MRKMVYVTLIGLTVLFGACKETEKDAGPDLTTDLVSRFNATYIITDVNDARNSTSGANAVVQFERVNNNTLTVIVTIDDNQAQVNDRYNATVTLGNPSDDGLLIPGLRNIYKLTANHLNDKGSSVSNVNLYQDGKIRGGIAYGNATGQLVSLAFIP